MESFDFNSLLPVIVLVVGAVLGFGLNFVKGLVAKSETKLDDAIWNKLVNEFTAAGVITQDQVAALKAQPPAPTP